MILFPTLHRCAITSAFAAFHVPIILSVHIPVGAHFKPAHVTEPVTLYGIS